MKRHQLTYQRSEDDWEEFFVFDENDDGEFHLMITGCRPKEGVEISDLRQRPEDMLITTEQAYKDLVSLLPTRFDHLEGIINKISLDTDHEPKDEILEVKQHGQSG